MGNTYFERTQQFGKYKISSLVVFHDAEETSVKLYLAIDDYGFYCRVAEFTLAQKLAPALKEMLVNQMVQTYGLMLLPDLIQWKEDINNNVIDTPEVRTVVKLRNMEEYTEDVAMSVIKAAIPNIKVKEGD